MDALTNPRIRNTRARKNLGDSGERVAAMFLQQRGYKILERNWRSHLSKGEIDLIAQDADGLAFIEVRTRRGDLMGAPEESLTPGKRTRLIALAQEFLACHNQFEWHAWRIDFVAIELARGGEVKRIEIIKDAVEG